MKTLTTSRMTLLLGLGIVIVVFSAIAKTEKTPGADPSSITSETLIRVLKLERHIEGGYFRRTFQADHRDSFVTPEGKRFSMTSIYYLLTAESPKGYFHLNKSDIAHFFHLGDPITYYLLGPKGEFKTFTLGSNPLKGELLQYVVPGGWWKASAIKKGATFGLISEAVSPGFDYADMQLGNAELLSAKYPEHSSMINKFTRTP